MSNNQTTVEYGVQSGTGRRLRGRNDSYSRKTPRGEFLASIVCCFLFQIVELKMDNVEAGTRFQGTICHPSCDRQAEVVGDEVGAAAGGGSDWKYYLRKVMMLTCARSRQRPFEVLGALLHGNILAPHTLLPHHWLVSLLSPCVCITGAARFVVRNAFVRLLATPRAMRRTLVYCVQWVEPPHTNGRHV